VNVLQNGKMVPPSTAMSAQQNGIVGGQSAGLPHANALPAEHALEQVKGGLPPERALSLQQTLPAKVLPASPAPPPSLPASLPTVPPSLPPSAPGGLPAS